MFLYFRSTRSVEALTTFVKQQLASSIKSFGNKEELEQKIDKSKRNIIAYFASKDTNEFQNFQKVAAILREDCAFWVSTDSGVNSVEENVMNFRDPDTEDEQRFTGRFSDYDYLKQWLTDKCIPLVREVTFENVEELTEEGLPFLLFFRNPKDKEGDKKFTELVRISYRVKRNFSSVISDMDNLYELVAVFSWMAFGKYLQVMRELYDQKSAVNALLADGHKFAHPLKHLGKTAQDLPVLAIDSFQHMFLFDNMEELHVPGKLRQFVLDLHSGKLHKDFHENLDQKVMDLQKLALERPEIFAEDDAKPPAAVPQAAPPSSVFKELKPSENRYSLLRKTEL
ncbi:unnamed protein product [Gongylonema pulchrum]|uniref:Thioredoxin domain-containing protein n=1 Tax=Gongylonema pulchrum TaxID=637853 RepID=A0A183DUC7_9BILA|nr:unnamed protein product [Gongylonema pulchrum]